MVTAFPCFSAFGKLQTGYNLQTTAESRKKTRRSGFFSGPRRLTWQQRRSRQQARQKRPLQALMRQLLAQMLGLLALSLPLALRLFCFWQCQRRRPGLRSV